MRNETLKPHFCVFLKIDLSDKVDFFFYTEGHKYYFLFLLKAEALLCIVHTHAAKQLAVAKRYPMRTPIDVADIWRRKEQLHSCETDRNLFLLLFYTGNKDQFRFTKIFKVISVWKLFLFVIHDAKNQFQQTCIPSIKASHIHFLWKRFIRSFFQNAFIC